MGKPYLEGRRFNKAFGSQRVCVCGHPYERHFDPYEDWAPVGCKYCPCSEFREADVISVIETITTKTRRSVEISEANVRAMVLSHAAKLLGCDKSDISITFKGESFYGFNLDVTATVETESETTKESEEKA